MFEKIVSNIGRFGYKHRKLIAIFGVILFIAVIILESYTIIEYTYAEESIVTEVFPQDDTLVIVYDNYDEESISKVINILQKNEHITSIQAYANTLGTELSPEELSQMLGIDTVFVNTLFYIYENGMLAHGMTFVDFAKFISSDAFIENEMFASMIDENSKAQIKQLGDLVDSLTNGVKYTSEDIAQKYGIESSTVQIIFYIKQLQNMNMNNATGTILGTIAGLLGMDSQYIQSVFPFEPVVSMTFDEFASTLASLYPYVSNVLDAEQAQQFEMLISIADTVRANEVLTPRDVSELFSSMEGAEMFGDDAITLLYIMSRSNTMDFSNKKISVYDFFVFITENIVNNEALSSFFDEDALAQIDDAKAQILDGKKQLVGKEHSRMVLTIDFAPESKEMYGFYDDLKQILDSNLHKDFYLVGSSAMGYEISNTFDQEFLLITIVTIIVILVVVFMTFKSFPLSTLLIAVIECAVFAMMGAMTVSGSPIYFVAVILVQCILMGTMIDYAILFTTYYREVRKEYTVKDALPETMKRSCYAILTSSLILALVTFGCYLFMEGMVAAILQALSIGAFSAIILILFVLPSFLAIFDKIFIKDGKKEEVIQE